MRGGLGRLRRCERGATAIEYGLILALVFLAMVGSLRGMAGAVINMWGNVSNTVATSH